MTIVLMTIGAVFVTAALVYALGPRTPVDEQIRFDSTAIGSDLDGYLALEESRFSDIRPGLQKQIVWAEPIAKHKTPLAIVYLHGFSASPGEIRPVPDELARSLGANLYFARLAGHGRAGDAMAEANVNDWLNDVAEALAIGHQLGERVLVIATSTGGSLVTYLLARPEIRQQVAAVILISPNYGLQAGGGFLLGGPWSKQLAHLILGARIGFQPVNAAHGALWTSDYPVDALLPMAAAVNLAAQAKVEEIDTPALFLISAEDKVVRPELTRAIAARWGGPHKLVELTGVGDPYQHVLAGDALSPGTNVIAETTMAKWITAKLGLKETPQ